MLEEDIEIMMKVIVVGNGCVGKSSLIRQYGYGSFTDEYKKTIGVDFVERQIDVNGEFVQLMLWDTAGQEEYDAITSAYYRGAQGCVIVYSVTDRSSFLAVERWKKKVVDMAGDDVVIVLVQNKIDLVAESVVSQLEAKEQAALMNVRLFQTSVKENLNVDNMFRYLAERYMSHVGEQSHHKETFIARPIGSLLPSIPRHRFGPVLALQTVYDTVTRRRRQRTRSGGATLRLADESTTSDEHFYNTQRHLAAAVKCNIF